MVTRKVYGGWQLRLTFRGGSLSGRSLYALCRTFWRSQGDELRPGDIALAMKYRLRETALPWREIDGEVIALDLGSGTYLKGNSAGGLLWRMLAMGATQKELAARLVSDFEIQPQHALADVKTFIGELQAAGLLEE